MGKRLFVMENESINGNRVLSVNNLSVYFFTPSGVVKAVDKVSFDVFKGRILAIVGESGSGKSVTALSTMKLVPIPPGKYMSGKIVMDGEDILAVSEKRLQEIRGKQISMIFQNPRAALNPSFTIFYQLIETIRRHDQSLSKKAALAYAKEVLRDVGVTESDQLGTSYPHQISSGMCQRVGLAMSIACNPELLIADEPTTMLDAMVQAKILLMLKQTSQEKQFPIIVITHDFGVVDALADEIIVMYAGMIQEQGEADMILNQPQHPYTKALILSVPNPGRPTQRLFQIEGQPPDLSRLPKGCSFADRCPSVMPICHEIRPDLYKSPTGSDARCHLFGPDTKGEQ
jgi:peptide/nickel transport system ATP-binding protein